MARVSAGKYLAVLFRAIGNKIAKKPIVVSFEVTLSCVANCLHCDTGGKRINEQQLKPEEYRKYIIELNPIAVQLSGGEPLLRKDLSDIIRAVKNGNSLPIVIVVSNGYLLNKDKYLELKDAGADRFSLSLDFPNEKHDEFRRLPGLFAHLSKIVPELVSLGNNDIAMNCCITKANLPYLIQIVEKCEEWGVKISFSAYSVKRTKDAQYFISSKEDLELLRKTIEELIKIRCERSTILNPVQVLWNTYTFFKEGRIGNCHAGYNFLVVRPEGTLNPCSMYRERRYTKQEELIKDFSANNNCGDCYVAIRAYCDKSLWSLFKESFELMKIK